MAGRESYILTVTPASGARTTFGSVQVAVDGFTFVPLQVQVYAKGDSTPLLSAGFTKVSYAKNATSLFSFAPPAGATVQHKALPAMTNAAGGMTAAPAASPKHVGLTLAQAQAKATANGLTLVTAGEDGHPAVRRRGCHSREWGSRSLRGPALRTRLRLCGARGVGWRNGFVGQPDAATVEAAAGAPRDDHDRGACRRASSRPRS